jgi:hypothetical protein
VNAPGEAAAIRSGCDIVATFNLSDFPASVLARGCFERSGA